MTGGREARRGSTPLPLAGKRALITGAARGLGRTYALHLARLGAGIAVVDLDLHSYRAYPEDAASMTADTVIDEIRQMGVPAEGEEADLGDPRAAASAIDRLSSRLGPIDVLVANAGGGVGSFTGNRASEMNLEQFRAAVEKNFYATVHTVIAVAPMMKRQRAGKIVTVASASGIQVNPSGSYAHYGAAKAAIIGYTRYLAQDLGPYGITVNCLAPGYIATGRGTVVFGRIGLDAFTKIAALRRLGTPEECARVVEFLVTDMSPFVTGAVIDVSGGAILGTNYAVDPEG